jgi:hypothetical protein
MEPVEKIAMTEITFAALLFSLVGVLYIGLGIPLMQERIPPNVSTVPEQRKHYPMKESGMP